MLNQIDLFRFLQIYVIQGFLLAIFLYLAYKILRYKKKRLNRVFSRFYISSSIGVLINFIYAPLQIQGFETVVLILNFLTNFFIVYSLTFFLIFLLILLRSEKFLTVRKELIIEIVYGIIFFSLIFFLPFGGVKIDASTNWKPVYSLPFYLYLTIILIIFMIIPILYVSFKIYNDFTDELLKKKWQYFLFGIISLIVFMFGTFTANFLNIEAFRSAWSIIAGILVLLGSYLVYYGVGKQIK
ncbi:MAG: conserved membrane protein of unknown function [Promethearchaeota archaeon]|nr:MAG: conserved membrane protein of unknown function [Candidatus Lokiarchaeota archaeon]